MTLDRPTFFAKARAAPFGGRLTQEQVEGLTAVLDAWRGDDDRHLAYILATAFHETAGTMAPVREGSTRTRRLTDAQARRAVAKRPYGKVVNGQVYYGRGLVQLTWERNYRAMGAALGVDLIGDPDLALDMDVAVAVLIEGMTNAATGIGDFTGRSLGQYFNATVDDSEGARRVVNGTDKASLIAGYHANFVDSIRFAREAAVKVLPPPAAVVEAAKPDGAHLATDKTAIGGVLAGLGGLGGAAAILRPVLEGIANPWALAAFGVVVVAALLVLTGRVQLKVRAGA